MMTTDFDAERSVLTVTASGDITHDDYQDTLIPAVENALASGGALRLLYVFTDGFENFSARAALDDTRLGIKHLKDFDAIGVVTDQAWVRHAVTAFAVFMPSAVRTFSLSELDAAKDWISQV